MFSPAMTRCARLLTTFTSCRLSCSVFALFFGAGSGATYLFRRTTKDHVFDMTQLRIAFFDFLLELIDFSVMLLFHPGNSGHQLLPSIPSTFPQITVVVGLPAILGQ